MDPMLKEWALFLDGCLERRIDPNLFDATAALLHAKSPLAGSKIAWALLKPRYPNARSIDPKIIVYTERLLASKTIDASEVLAAVFRFSRDRPSKTGENANPGKDDGESWTNPLGFEEIIFERLHKAFTTGQRPVSGVEARRTILVASKWMSAMVTSHTSDSMIQAMAGLQQQPQQQAINIREALGMFVVGLIENARVLDVLSKEHSKDIRKGLAQSLSTFIPFLSQTSLPVANRLELSQREHDFHDKSLAQASGEANETAGLEVAALQLDAVMDLPNVNTRAGLFIYLNALLVARPMTDDFAICSYLHSRYKVDASNLGPDLVTASFDILANAMYQNESSQTLFCLKSFLINKVPLLLAQLSPSLFPMTPELCITQALGHVDPNAFPSFSQGFDDMLGNSNPLSDVRQDFLNACALHGQIPKDAIARLLGETPMQAPPQTRYLKKDVLSQCKDNFERVTTFVEELDNLDGNAGAIVAALVEFIAHLCETQTTMYLKTLCNLLSRKSQALDVILQFTTPVAILRPLCQFLDEWRYDGDQGEYQPVYDEFGAILLLILAFVHRYKLTYYDLGIAHGTFVARLLQRGHHAIPTDDLTEEQSQHIGNWLIGLYDTDKEALSNEVFASCRPQDFYLIVPSLFIQTVMAASSGVLSLDTVKGGLEYLHETFLLPCLVGGLTWMASHAEVQTQQDLDVCMQIFKKLIESAPTSGEAQAMHSTVLAIVAARLERCFRNLKLRHPNRTDVDQLLMTIKSSLNYQRTPYSTMSEYDQWTSAVHSIITTTLRRTVQRLSQWGAAGALQPNPPNYTHRQVYTSLKLEGAFKTLRAIVEEVKAQTEAGNGAAALDTGVSLISAPLLENTPIPADAAVATQPRTKINMREALKAEYDNAAALVSSDPLYAETLVRLHRRVEAQCLAITQAGLSNAPIELANVGLVDMPTTQDAELDKALNDAAAASIAAVGGTLQGQPDQDALQRSLDQHLDLSAAGGALDLSSMGVGTGAADMTADMGALPDLDLTDMGGMGMDLGEDDDAWGLDFDNM